MTDKPYLVSPLITAVIPTFRRSSLLKRAVKSVLDQEMPRLEVAVFDNASGDETDKTIFELSSRDARIRYHCHKTNLGASANFDFGIRQVKTPFFSILSDDDYLLPGFYELALADLAKYPDAMFWAGLTLNVDEQGLVWDARLDRWSREGLFAPPEGLMAMMHGMAPVWTGIVFRREILDCIGFPDQETLGPMDLDFTLKAAASCPYIMSKHPSAVFTLSAISFSAKQPLSSFWPGWQKMLHNLEANNKLEGEAKIVAVAALRKDAQRMLLRRGANALAMGRYEFVHSAATALRKSYGTLVQQCLLLMLSFACERSSGLKWLYTYLYRMVEIRLINSRTDLQTRYGHLIRQVE